MSSILDALNKLEQEKAQASREAERSDTDPISVASELVGRSVMRDRVTLRVTPVALLVSVGALVVGLVAITFVAVMMLTQPDRGAPPATETAAAVPATAPSTTVEAPAPSPAAQAAAPSVAPSIEDSKPAEVAVPAPVAMKESFKPADLPAAAPAVSDEAAKPSPVKIDPPASVPEATSPKPETKSAALPEKTVDAPKVEPTANEPDPVAKAPDAPPRTRKRVAAKADDTNETPARALPGSAPGASRNAEVKLELLPILTPQDQIRFGFIRLKVNMVKPSGDTNPQGSAILTLEEESSTGDPVVNRMPFYEGQRLQQSTLRLFKVGPDRIGVEDMRSGEQYQLPI